MVALLLSIAIGSAGLSLIISPIYEFKAVIFARILKSAWAPVLK